MAIIRLSGVQMVVGPSKKENLPRILEHIKRCDCDFILFPEMALTGHNNNFSDTRTQEAWDQIATLCRQRYVTAIVGTGARVDGQAYIQSRIFSDEGDIIHTYDKIMPTREEREWCRPGGELEVYEDGDLTYGCLIGNDLWVTPDGNVFPDRRLSLQLGQKGAQIIFHSNDSGTDPLYRQWHEANLQLRARESGCYIVTVNAAAENRELNAPSGVIGPDGEWLIRVPLKGEQHFDYDLDME